MRRSALVLLVPVALVALRPRPHAAPPPPDATAAAAHAADLLAGRPLRTTLSDGGGVVATGVVTATSSHLAVGDAAADVGEGDPVALLAPLRRGASWDGDRLVLAGTPLATADLAPDGSLVRLDVDLGDGLHLVTEPG